MARGYVYLAVVLDWASRRVLSWRVSITMEAAFLRRDAARRLGEARQARNLHTDQVRNSPAQRFTGVLADNAIAISMDGKGAWRITCSSMRLWRSVQRRRGLFAGLRQRQQARTSIGRYLDFLQSPSTTFELDGTTPDQAYFNPLPSAGSLTSADVHFRRGNLFRQPGPPHVTIRKSDRHCKRVEVARQRRSERRSSDAIFPLGTILAPKI